MGLMTSVTYDSMISKEDDFSQSGPLHLSHVNWTNAHHRMSVTASLVNGVSVLERHRQCKRQGPQALASPWWKSFHFELVHTLVDANSSIFGAKYEFIPPKSQSNDSLDERPRYVIAFRGTMRKAELESLVRDLKLDISIVWNRLHKTSCFEIAIQAIKSVVCDVGESNVWLAGHSLGAAIALLAGKTMAKEGKFIQTFLFSSPFVSAPLEIIKDERVKLGVRITSSVIKAGLATVKKNQQATDSIDPFTSLANWYPCLFVNRGDLVCSEYIPYFNHRKKMDKLRIGHIERLATANSLGGLVMSAFGRESEPLHLIPSAYLTENLTPAWHFKEAHEIHQWWENFKEAHGIHQWWKPDLQVHSELHKYK